MKKYYMYKKIDHLSTNYIQQKFDNLKKKFNDYYPKYKV